MWTLQNAAILLSLAALGGLTMLIIRLRGGTNPPTWLALGHGLFAVSGVAILLYLYANGGLPQLALWALGIFVLAAVGGLTLFLGFQMRGRLLPVPIVVAHGLLAATGLGILLKAIYG